MAKPKGPKKTNGDAGTTAVETASQTVETTAAESMSAARKSTGRPAIVKNDTRASVVPINLDDEIRRLAYLLSERRGFEPGHEAEDWLTAEREIRQRYQPHSA
jgi:hypothetical protein